MFGTPIRRSEARPRPRAEERTAGARRRLRRAAGLFAALLLFLLSPCGGDSVSVQELAGDGIVFVSSREEGRPQLYVMNADGSKVARVLKSDTRDTHPVWSPDQTRIAFLRQPLGQPAPGSSQGDDQLEIWVWPVDGSGEFKVADMAAEAAPAWSPDGQKLAFASDRDGDRDIYVVDANGSNLTNLTNDNDRDGEPDWSPDGTQLAFSEPEGVSIMSSDGSDVRSLTTIGGESPVWSPDGAKIAFKEAGEIAVRDADGSDLRIVSLQDGSTTLTFAGPPVWSPDSPRIAFVSAASGTIWVVNADGTGLRKVAAGLVDDPTFNLDTAPAWSPDGIAIAFVCGRGDFEICTVNADGSNEVQITDNDAPDLQAAWSSAP